jgi:TRAP-type mannitol/chloroaromatic compound transport system permease small subunit
MSDPDIPKLDITDEMIAERRSDGPMPPDMWLGGIATAIDTFSLWVGRLACLLLIPMMGVVIIEVVSRKFFQYFIDWGLEDLARTIGLGPTDYAYDLSRWTMGAMFMLGAGYALMKGVHIRADFLYRTMSVRNQARVDLFLYLIFFFPSMILFTWVSFHYFQKAWGNSERSMDTAWMQVVWPVYSTLPLGGLFLIIQGVSESLKCFYAMRMGRWP